MKSLKYLLQLIPAAVLLFLASCSVKPETIRIMSYNIRLSLVDDGEHNWNIRKPASVEMVKTLQPDVFGVQEPVWEQINFLLDSLPAYAKLGVAREDGDSLGEFSAIFYLKDKFEVLREGNFWLSETPDVPSLGWDAAYKRIVTWGAFKNKETENIFYIFNTHFDHLGKVARQESACLLIDRIREITVDAPVIFITGDFNATIDDPLFEPVKAHFLNVRQEAPLTDTISTYNGWGTYDGAPIDHIFYRGAKALSFRTVTDNFGVPYVSDHYPVLAVFEYE
ncbi:MAG: endonuclease/exonuclease/phosphatase family protein [Bacteroidales bacterium]|jgi:endonuclease/exonuclease/phosphatase family metal-dependent hydrolase|nr:endonuclease/exonuclease/phosphatase family protein [Bacteroidales bacterium]